MNRTNIVLTSLLLTSTAFAAADDRSTGKTPGATAEATQPASLVVEEEWWYPLRMDSVDAMSRARYYYRRDNEMAAADEIRKAASWISYAADHAQPQTTHALLGARTNLLTLADDLDTGKVAGAARLDEALGQASHALAEWHYYRAKDELGRSDAKSAAQDLEAAAGHLENAAESAHLRYGADTISVFEDIYHDGRLVSEGKTIDNNKLGEHLETIESAVETMARSLRS